MWSTRIIEAVRRTGGEAVGLASDTDLSVALEAADLAEGQRTAGAGVDLNGRRYDGVAAIEAIAAARLPVIAVARHDDELTRKRAFKAGASRVFSYDMFFRDGTRLVETWFTADGDHSV